MPIVLLEDNVRHAKMLNWVIERMERHNIFEHGDLAGISTCFCCAANEEREAIKYRGQTVPVTAVVDFKAAKIDVATPRDLMFDGFVVETPAGVGRLPGIFMDVAKLFKIKPSRADVFEKEVRKANVAFCESMEEKFETPIPLKWTVGAEAISHVTGYSLETSMARVMKGMRGYEYSLGFAGASA